MPSLHAFWPLLCAARVVTASPFLEQRADTDPLPIGINWSNVVAQLKTTATLQSVAMPPLLADSPVRQTTLESLQLVSQDYVRFVPWYPYPQLAVPELDPPAGNGADCKTSWNFTYADQIVGDFLKYTPGVKHIINFSTIPGWMWETDTPYSYPSNVSEIDNNYNNGTRLRDGTFKEVSDYFQRLVSWYVNGGFTDECGVVHQSGYHMDIEFWEVLNEPEFEHGWSVNDYTKLYDAVTASIHSVAPNITFVGLGMGTRNLTWFENFLDTTKHQPNTPLEWISYHFYAVPSDAATAQQASQAFDSANNFIAEVQNIEDIRLRRSPTTKTTLNEVGTFDPKAAGGVTPGYVIPKEYWAWSGGIFAYVFSKVAQMGIDAVGQSQLIGYPGQYESVSQVDYRTGLPNARLRTLQLLQTSFHQGDSFAETSVDETMVHAQAFVSADGTRNLLIVNKLGNEVAVAIPDWGQGSSAAIVDADTAGNIWSIVGISNGSLNVPPYAVVVVTQ